jgi:hypothetical protein
MPIFALIAIILGSLAVGFGGGWGVKGWKDGATVAEVKSQKAAVESRNVELQSANSNCATDIEGVKKGVAVVVAHVEEREKAASDAMKAADLTIAQHKVKAATIKKLPTIAQSPAAQCAAIIREQVDYVRERKG